MLAELLNFQSHSLFSLLLFVKRYLSSWLRWVASQWEVLAAVDNMGFAGSYVAWSVLFFLCWRDFVSPIHSFDFLSSGLIMFSKRCFHWFMDPRVGWVRLLKHQEFFYRIDKEKRSCQTQMCYFWGIVGGMDLIPKTPIPFHQDLLVSTEICLNVGAFFVE